MHNIIPKNSAWVTSLEVAREALIVPTQLQKWGGLISSVSYFPPIKIVIIVVIAFIFIGTFGVYNPTLTVQNSKMCFSIEFVRGSDTEECLVEYKSIDGSVDGFVIIERRFPINCSALKLKSNNYTVTFYEGNSNKTEYIVAILLAKVFPTTASVSSSPSMPFSSAMLSSSIAPSSIMMPSELSISPSSPLASPSGSPSS